MNSMKKHFCFAFFDLVSCKKLISSILSFSGETVWEWNTGQNSEKSNVFNVELVCLGPGVKWGLHLAEVVETPIHV